MNCIVYMIRLLSHINIFESGEHTCVKLDKNTQGFICDESTNYYYITKYLGNNMLHHDALENVFIIDDPFPGSCYVYESLCWIQQPLVLSQHRKIMCHQPKNHSNQMT